MLVGRRDCRGRLRVCTADVPAASPWGAGQGYGPFCICPTSPCCGWDRGKDAGERRGSGGCQQANAAEPGRGTARSLRPRQNVGEAAPQSLCLGVSSASSPLQPDGLGPGDGVFSHEEVFFAWLPRAEACCYDNRRRLLRAERHGRKGRKRDGGGEGLSQERVRQRHGGSMQGAGMEDTPRDAAVRRGWALHLLPRLMTPVCKRRVWACRQCCMPAA